MHINLIGSIQIEQDGQAVQGFRSQKALALLAYLIMSKRPLPRTTLAALFWGDLPESDAKAELRKTLHNLSSKLPNCLAVDRQTVCFQPVEGVPVDIHLFANGEQADDMATLRQTAVLVRGPFLDGLVVDDSPDWETWLLTERTQWQRRSINLLERLITRQADTGDVAAAMETCQQLLTVEPWREASHRLLMRLLVRNGDGRAALRQFDACRRILADELAVTPEPETIALMERIKTAVSRPSTLPTPPTHFVGRTGELADIAQQLSQQDCRLLTLIGPGGMGKTRLALQAAARHHNRFLDGVWFVSLESIHTLEMLVTAVTDTLHIPTTTTTNPGLQLQHVLSDKEMLLVLDNCETMLDQVPEGVNYLAGLLSRSPEVKMIATSRQALRIRGEWQLHLHGLPLDSDHETAAEQLFAQSARRVYPGFSLAAERSDVQRICQLAAGMPLAIELAAGWRKLISCAEIVAEIEQGLAILSSEHADLPHRHRNLLALFQSSYQRLASDEQAVLTRLAIFPASFNRETAVSVCQTTLPILASLVDQSMLTVQETNTPTGSRYSLHPLLRQFCREQKTAVLNTIQSAFIDTFTTLLKTNEAALLSANRQSALQTISEEIDNVRGYWQTLLATEDWSSAATALHAQHLFFELKGWFHEAEQLFGQAADIVARAALQPPNLLHRLQARQGWHAWRLGRLELAQTLAEQSLSANADRWEKAFAHHLLGLVADGRSNYPTAKVQFNEALTIWRDLEDAWGTAVTLFRLGRVHQAMGDFQQAGRPFWEGLALVNEAGYQFGATTAVGELSRLAASITDYAQARELCTASLEAHKQVGDPWGVAAALDNLGAIHCGLWQFDKANESLQSSLAIRRQLDDQAGIATTLDLLGQVAYAQGDFKRAIKYSRRSLTIYHLLGDQKRIARALNNQGRSAYLQTDYDTAKSAFIESLTQYSDLGHRAGMAAVRSGLGFVALAEGDLETAVHQFDTALAEALSIDAAPVALDVLLGKAALLTARGQPAQAAAIQALVKGHPAAHDGIQAQAQRLFGTQVWTAVSPAATAGDLETAVARILKIGG